MSQHFQIKNTCKCRRHLPVQLQDMRHTNSRHVGPTTRNCKFAQPQQSGGGATAEKFATPREFAIQRTLKTNCIVFISTMKPKKMALIAFFLCIRSKHKDLAS